MEEELFEKMCETEQLFEKIHSSEAQRTKTQADALEIKEHAQWKAKRDAKIASLEDQFLRKQALEMHGLLKRIQSGREEQKHARKTELERLLQR